ncbi:hypothetical protein MHU86_13556 [Fragilaria crotonensis]|nr:hypothetical protein MHU86_13556 [Fragilaria crotonensis]
MAMTVLAMQANATIARDRKKDLFSTRILRHFRYRQPMFGVKFTCQGGLRWETETVGSGSEGIRGNEDNERASRHATLELGGLATWEGNIPSAFRIHTTFPTDEEFDS